MTALATLKNGTIIAYAVKRDGEVCVANEAFSGGRVWQEPCHLPHVRSPRWSYAHALIPAGGGQYKSRAEAVIAMFEAVAAATATRAQKRTKREWASAPACPDLTNAQAAVNALFGRET